MHFSVQIQPALLGALNSGRNASSQLKVRKIDNGQRIAIRNNNCKVSQIKIILRECTLEPEYSLAGSTEQPGQSIGVPMARAINEAMPEPG